MDGLLFVNKPKGMTSRDVVNVLCKRLNTSKIGHIGTLDPNASGVLVLCVNKALKLVELMSEHDKTYIATVKLGIKTDTYDICGNIISNRDYSCNKDMINNALLHFKGSYLQTVPVYSSCKVNGKKLYDYARSNTFVELPKRMVNIYDIKLIDYSFDSFSFSVSVSKGTYIRSLVNDISEYLDIDMTLSDLLRTKLGNVSIDDCKNLNDITSDDIKPFIDYLDMPKVKVYGSFKRMVSNGVVIDNRDNYDMVLFMDDDKPISIYRKNDKNELRAYKVF